MLLHSAEMRSTRTICHLAKRGLQSLLVFFWRSLYELLHMLPQFSERACFLSCICRITTAVSFLRHVATRIKRPHVWPTLRLPSVTAGLNPVVLSKPRGTRKSFTAAHELRSVSQCVSGIPIHVFRRYRYT